MRLKIKNLLKFSLTILGFFVFVNYFYQNILLKKTRIFKSCPFSAKEFDIPFNANEKLEIRNYKFDNKLLVRNPQNNRCIKIAKFAKNGFISKPTILKIQNNKSIQEYLIDKHVIINLKKYEKVNCPNNAFNIAFFGQSNSANNVKPKTNIESPNNLYQYNWKDESCYLYKEPLLGATGNQGNTITSFAISLAVNNKDKNFLISPFGVGGSLVESWAHGELNFLLEKNLTNLLTKNLNVNLFIWHQGESNASNLNYLQIDPKIESSENYIENLSKIIDRTRDFFPESYFGVSLASKCEHLTPSKYITNAQRKVTQIKEKVYIAANSDSLLGEKYRYDNCHFNLNGAYKLSEMYEKSFKKNVFNY